MGWGPSRGPLSRPLCEGEKGEEDPKQLRALASRDWGVREVLRRTQTQGGHSAAADCWGGGCREPGDLGPPGGEGRVTPGLRQDWAHAFLGFGLLHVC